MVCAVGCNADVQRESTEFEGVSALEPQRSSAQGPGFHYRENEDKVGELASILCPGSVPRSQIATINDIFLTD